MKTSSLRHISGILKRLLKERLIFPGLVSCFILVLLFTPAAACAQEAAAPPPQEAASPQPADEPVQRFLFWPLVSEEESAEWRQISVLPVYVKKERTDGSEEKVQVLWPLYLFRRSGKDITIRIFPLFTYWRDVYEYKAGTETDSQYMVFPILFGGDSTEEGGYFAVFPLGGKIKHFLGRDEINFILFPLYSNSRKGELHRRSYLWPVLSFSEGGGYNGFRIWPLYGRFQKEEEYRNLFVLWPFYNHQEYDLDKEQPGERLFVFPFYAREDSGRRHYRGYLWPFFTFEENLAKNYVERATPWPFIVMTRGDITRTQYWPFYGHTKTKEAETTFVAWPFWSRRSYETEDGAKRNEASLLPILATKTELSEEGEVLFHKQRVWPLWRFRKYEDGSTHVQAPVLLWFDDEQGFERQYAPLWTLYERITTAEGETRTYAFWRLFQSVDTPTQTRSSLPLIYNYENDTEQDSERMQILKGFFGTYREGAEGGIQMLYFLRVPRSKGNSQEK